MRFGSFYSNLFEQLSGFLSQFKIEQIEKFNWLGNDENFTTQLDWMINRDTQEGLTKICYENLRKLN